LLILGLDKFTKNMNYLWKFELENSNNDKINFQKRAKRSQQTAQYYNILQHFEIYLNSEIKFKHFISVFVSLFGDLQIPDTSLDKLLKFIRAIVPQEKLNLPKTYSDFTQVVTIT
jgi:hypothetical protein